MKGLMRGKKLDRIDRLLLRATPKPTPLQLLQQDNPYMGKSCEELLDYMSGDDYRAPYIGAPGWNMFIYALVHSASTGGLSDVEESVNEVWMTSKEFEETKIVEEYIPYTRRT